VKCSYDMDFILNYSDGNISMEKEKAFEEHLKECTGCRNILSKDTALKGFIKTSIPAVNVPVEAIFSRIDTTRYVKSTGKFKLAGLLHRLVPPRRIAIPVTAIAVVLVLVLVKPSIIGDVYYTAASLLESLNGRDDVDKNNKKDKLNIDNAVQEDKDNDKKIPDPENSNNENTDSRNINNADRINQNGPGQDLETDVTMDGSITDKVDIPDRKPVLKTFGADMRDVAWNGGRYVAIGTGGTLLYSEDGQNWTEQFTGESADGSQLNGIIWDGSRFIAVGNIILTSGDGKVWSKVPDVKGYILTDVCSGSDKLVAVGYIPDPTGDIPVVLESENATDWKENKLVDIKGRLESVAWNGSIYAAAGTEGVITSGNGRDWASPRNVVWRGNRESNDVNLYDIAWSGNRFVAVGDAMLISNNGDTWTEQYIESDFKARVIVWNGNRFIALGYPGKTYASHDGSDWKKLPGSAYGIINSAVWDGGKYLAVGQECAIYTSVDGENWDGARGLTGSRLNDIVWTGSRYIAVGAFGSGNILVSPDGSEWSVYNMESSGGGIADADFTGIAWNGRKAAVVGYDGAIFTSGDGEAWARQQSRTDSNLNGIAWNGKAFVAVGDDGTLISSEDGENWAGRASGTGADISGIVWDGEKFVAVGNGVILQSADGVKWTRKTVNGWLYDIEWNGRELLAAGENVYVSADGVNWSEVKSPGEILRTVEWGKDFYIAAGYNGSVFASSNGTDWIKQPVKTFRNLEGAVYNNSRFIIVGWEGTILEW